MFVARKKNSLVELAGNSIFKISYKPGIPALPRQSDCRAQAVGGRHGRDIKTILKA